MIRRTPGTFLAGGTAITATSSTATTAARSMNGDFNGKLVKHTVDGCKEPTGLDDE